MSNVSGMVASNKVEKNSISKVWMLSRNMTDLSERPWVREEADEML
jgi:hypothetical protein